MAQDAAPDIEPVEKYDTTQLETILRESLDAAQKQSEKTVDYGVKTSAEDLNRALENAQTEYQTTRNQIDLNERQAMDNSALYAETRGDRGGIGQSQYDSIQNSAAQSRLALNNAQTQAASDTARQVADLRAQGEFEKADQMLQLTQDYLAKLMTLKQWGAEYNLSVDQMNTALEEWKADYERAMLQFRTETALNEAQLTGYYNGQRTLAGQEYDLEQLSSKVSALVNAGVTVDPRLLMQMGYSYSEASQLSQAWANAAKKSSGSGSGSRSSVDNNYVALAKEAVGTQGKSAAAVVTAAYQDWASGTTNQATYNAVVSALSTGG